MDMLGIETNKPDNKEGRLHSQDKDDSSDAKWARTREFSGKLRDLPLRAGMISSKVNLPTIAKTLDKMDSRMYEYFEGKTGLNERQQRVALAVGAVAIGAIGVGMYYAKRKIIGELAEGYSPDDGMDVTPNPGLETPMESSYGDELWDNHDVGGSIDNPVETDKDITPGASQEFHTVEIQEGVGTSQFANHELGIDFDSRADWDEFNSQTNSLFEGLDGTYEMPNGDVGFNTGGVQIPQEILDKMLEVAEDIKS
jgi:hypothetical protein